MPPRVVLIGLPGSGKSTVGAALATKLGVPFADSDDMVRHMTGRAVGKIILDDGENAFRELEATAIADAVADFDGVLSLGGGAITTQSVRDVLRESGVPIALLIASEGKLLERIGGAHHRPLLAGDTAKRLAELTAIREPLYLELATHTFDTDLGTVSEIAVEVANRLANT